MFSLGVSLFLYGVLRSVFPAPDPCSQKQSEASRTTEMLALNERLQTKLLEVGTAHRLAACTNRVRELEQDRWVWKHTRPLFVEQNTVFGTIACQDSLGVTVQYQLVSS